MRDATDELAWISDSTLVVGDQHTATKDERKQISGYLQTPQRPLCAAHRARQEAEIRVVSPEQQIAQRCGNAHPDRRPC